MWPRRTDYATSSFDASHTRTVRSDDAETVGMAIALGIRELLLRGFREILAYRTAASRRRQRFRGTLESRRPIPRVSTSTAIPSQAKQPQDHPSPTPSAASSEINEPPSPAFSAKRALKRSNLASLALRADLSWMRWGRADGAGEEELSTLSAKQLLKQ